MNQDNVVLIISAITGIIGMPIIQWAKNQFELDGNWALLLATIISLILGFLVAIFGGQVTIGQPVTLETVVQSATVIFSIASIFYKLLLGDKKIG